MHKQYIIGSTALKNLYPNCKKIPQDIDYLVKVKKSSDRTGDIHIEYHQNPILYNYLQNNNLEINGDILLTLKTSHIFWDIFWDKHMFDIVFLHENGAKLIKPLFEDLYLYWNKIHGEKKRSNLNMTAEDFFNNAIKCPIDHDTLHSIINPIPTYSKMLKDGAEVDVDEVKFNNLSFDDKLNSVREEVYVMAYERLGERDYRTAYSWMLKKFIRDHSPIWQAIFIMQNYRILHLPKINYVKKINTHLKNKQKNDIRRD